MNVEGKDSLNFVLTSQINSVNKEQLFFIVNSVVSTTVNLSYKKILRYIVKST